MSPSSLSSSHSSSTPSRHLPYLDGWRGIAITFVLIEHFSPLNLGRTGVDTFFALSGLLMAKVLFEDKVPLGTFYRNRAARIFPVFFLYLLVLALGAWVWMPAVDWASLTGSALFVRTYWPAHHMWMDALPIANLWSLNVEEHSYVLLSLVSLLTLSKSERAARWMLSALVLLCMLAYGLYARHPEVLLAHLRTECAALPLMLSAALFLWRRALRPHIPARLAALVVFATAVLVLVGLFAPPPRFGNVFKHFLLPAMLALSVNVLQDAPAAVQRVLSHPVLTWLGMCSFSIYLWHYPFFHWLNALHSGPVLALAMALGVSALSFHCYEQPMRQWIRGAARPRQDRAVAHGSGVVLSVS